MKSTLLTLIVSCLFFSACTDQSQTNTQQTTAETPKNTNVSAVTEQPAVAPKQASEPQVDERLKAGKDIYDKRCKACHGADGMGANDSLPPLAKSDYFSEDKMQLVASIAKGIRGQITVNGKTYDGIMPALPMKDEELAAVSTYVLNMFDNKGGEITVEEIAAFRAEK